MKEQLSPMMQQYLKTKEEYPDCILFYRLGDFYEMFFEDAKLVSKELELTLTGKECGLKERAPMCGVPFHAADTYVDRLVKNGHKVAIAEQMEDPKLAKGLVKREVIRITTPGTVLTGQSVSEESNNYIMCIFYAGGGYGLSVCDVTTGEFYLSEVKSNAELVDEIYKFHPAELIVNEEFNICGVDLDEIKERLGFLVSYYGTSLFDDSNCYNVICRHFHVSSIGKLGLSEYSDGIISAGALLTYLYDTQKNGMRHITEIVPYSNGKFMILDNVARRNLELVRTMWNKEKKGSLLWVLDSCKTAMGARLLRSYIEQPLMDKKEILYRQDAVCELKDRYSDRQELIEYIAPIYDLERLIGKISYRSANPRDLIALKNSLVMLPAIKNLISAFDSQAFKDCAERLDTLEDIYKIIDDAINEDPPIMLREGGILKEGYSAEADTLRSAGTEGKNWLATLEAEEREKTGIKGLKIKFNKVFGYYFEVTNSFKNMVPDYFERKQTLVGAERYTMPRLKELEGIILGADDKLNALEYEEFCRIRDTIGGEIARVQKTAHMIARLDVFCSLAEVAEKNGYIRPDINEKGILKIKDGRHPVVEKMIEGGLFVPNDVDLNDSEKRISIITGPNMAGKSTYMRQTALIVLMAQMGSLVPASKADICICDRIFTRVGASDDLASGQSTFMVEMNEVAGILKNATRKSLIILDEIGRGTSTYDGMAIAWAVVEYISDKRQIGAKTLFATHYHELTELEGTIDGVQNHCIAVKEQGENIVFLRKIVKGGADKSYGIQVAKLAGVPEKVLQRAKELVSQLSDSDIAKYAADATRAGFLWKGTNTKKKNAVPGGQMSLGDICGEECGIAKTDIDIDLGDDNARKVVKELYDIDPSVLTPLEALTKVYEWKKALNKD